MRWLVILYLLILGACAGTVRGSGLDAAEAVEPTEPSALQLQMFGPLVDLVGRRFRGEPASGSSENRADFQVWNWALGGAAIRVDHALEDGSHGGVTYIYPDRQSGDLAYVYITNSGFRTEGSFRLNADGSWTAEEEVIGRGEITRVRSTGRIRENGTMLSQGTYLKGNQWVPGASFEYAPTDAELPSLRPPDGR